MRAWPRSLSALILLAGCGGAGTHAPQTVGGVSSPTGTTHRPRVVAAVRTRPHETLAAQATRPVALRATPSPGARVVAKVPQRTRFHSPSVMAVVRRRGTWLAVTSERLKNGHVGWIRQNAVKLLREQWRIDIDLSGRRAVLTRLGRRVTSFPVATGSPSTPTPPGRYGVTDRLRTGGAGSPYGCCVLALSGHQPDVPQDWPGGDRLAIHGTSDPSSIGQAASHGCLRATEQSMRLLIARVPLGTQVVIRR